MHLPVLGVERTGSVGHLNTVSLQLLSGSGQAYDACRARLLSGDWCGRDLRPYRIKSRVVDPRTGIEVQRSSRLWKAY